MAYRLILVGCLVFFFAFCNKKEEECPKKKVYLPVIDVTGHWYEDIVTKKYLLAQSNKGRAESYTLSFRNTYTNLLIEDCLSIYGEARFAYLSSSLYDHTFVMEIERKENVDYFTIGKDNFFCCSFDYVKFDVHKPDSCILSYPSPSNSYPNYKTVLPLQIIDSLIVKNKTYYKVYKIAFPSLDMSLDRKTKILFINSRSGVIQFETFDGEIWSLY